MIEIYYLETVVIIVCDMLKGFTHANHMTMSTNGQM